MKSFSKILESELLPKRQKKFNKVKEDEEIEFYDLDEDVQENIANYMNKQAEKVSNAVESSNINSILNPYGLSLSSATPEEIGPTEPYIKSNGDCYVMIGLDIDSSNAEGKPDPDGEYDDLWERLEDGAGLPTEIFEKVKATLSKISSNLEINYGDDYLVEVNVNLNVKNLL